MKTGVHSEDVTFMEHSPITITNVGATLHPHLPGEPGFLCRSGVVDSGGGRPAPWLSIEVDFAVYFLDDDALVVAAVVGGDNRLLPLIANPHRKLPVRIVHVDVHAVLSSSLNGGYIGRELAVAHLHLHHVSRLVHKQCRVRGHFDFRQWVSLIVRKRNHDLAAGRQRLRSCTTY